MSSPATLSLVWRLFIFSLFLSSTTNVHTSATPLPHLSRTNDNRPAHALTKRLTGLVQEAGEPVLIDPAGVYIRASPLQNAGGIIAGYAAVDNGEKVLRVATSTNNAQSWTYMGEVTRRDDATHDIDNAMPLQLPSGRIVYAFRNHDRTGPGLDAYTYYRITMSYSDDGGRSWEFLSQVVERPANTEKGMKNGLWEPFLRMARDGSTLQVYYSSENNDDDQDNLMKYSRDDGLTWSEEEVMVSGGDTPKTRDGMTGVAEVGNDGGLVCVFESEENGIFRVLRVISHDDGHSWGERALVYTAANGKDAGAPQIYNVGGTLVTSFMTNEGVDTPMIDGGQTKVVTSVNGAADWSSMTQDGTVTGQKGSHWPGLYTLDENHFLALYSKSGVGAVSQLYKIV